MTQSRRRQTMLEEAKKDKASDTYVNQNAAFQSIKEQLARIDAEAAANKAKILRQRFDQLVQDALSAKTEQEKMSVNARMDKMIIALSQGL